MKSSKSLPEDGIGKKAETCSCHVFDLLASDFFLILAHPVYKMWIIQEPNMLELWIKLHFEGEKTESIYHV